MKIDWAEKKMEQGVDEIRKAKRWQAALAAMQGLLACPELEGAPRQFANWAFEYADAMLAAEAGSDND